MWCSMNPTDAKAMVLEQVEGWLDLFDDDMKAKEGVAVPSKVLELLAKFEQETQPSYPFALDYTVFQFPPNSGTAEADVWFGRAMAWTFGFNFEEASHCFQRSLDSASERFALGHWGLALCHGPYYNRHGARYVKEGRDDQAKVFNIAQGLIHAKEAKRISIGSATNNKDPIQLALIDALLVRFTAYKDNATNTNDTNELQACFDFCERKYADELRNILQKHPDDPNVGAFLAAALMNLNPWKLWLPTDATPRKERIPAPDTIEIQTTVRHGLSIAPNHPGLCHLWIHAMEMAPDPALSLPQATLLAQEGANKQSEIGHLSHMAAHIYMQVGNYQAAIDTSLHAVAADAKMIAIGQCGVGVYSGAVHNLHELLFACMWAGNVTVGREALLKLEKTATDSGIQRLPSRLEPFGLAKFHFMIRFGLWNEILSIPNILKQDQEFLCATYANQCYARGVAYAALGDVANAEREQKKFQEARLLPLLKDEGAVSKRRLHNIPEQRKLDVAEELLQGEILYRKGEFDQCFEVLKRGVHLDDNLDFDEPWGWMVPVRHALAALLSEQGLWQEAIDVYKQDLKLHPKNIWALVGLRDCLKHNGVDAELDRVLAMITEVSASTGVEPPLTSCACAVVKWNEGRGKSSTGGTEEAKKSCCS